MFLGYPFLLEIEAAGPKEIGIYIYYTHIIGILDAFKPDKVKETYIVQVAW